MYKVLTIGGEDYKVEFTIEASLYKECITAVTDFMMNSAESVNEQDQKRMIREMSGIPEMTITMFYAGLLEYHGPEGDGKVTKMSDAKKLIKQWMRENPDDENANLYGMMSILLDQMREDGFFKQCGLTQMMAETEKEIKKPQDHKKKITKISEAK